MWKSPAGRILGSTCSPVKEILPYKGSSLSHACASCKITIRGSFEVRWVDYLGDMLHYIDVKDGKVATTTLIGRPPDLAAFLGKLNLLVDMGFPVVAFEYKQEE